LNPLEWTEAEWKTRERLGRYRTAAERSFHRALTAIEARRKSRMAEFAQETRLEQAAQRIELTLLHRREQVRIANEKLALRKAELAQRAAEAERKAAERVAERAEAKKVAVSAAKKKKKNGGFGVAEQWLEIRVTEGVTTTEFIPSNEELLEEIAKAVEGGEEEPEMVYRRMNFPEGVPPEYAWTNSHDVASCELTLAGQWCEGCARFLHAGAGIQRMTFATWKDVIAREGAHAGPTGVGNLPRPKERGGDMAFAEMLELLGQGRGES
jgi:predicted O-linked N-acetylglucosamine transferase (SPINDLY family)